MIVSFSSPISNLFNVNFISKSSDKIRHSHSEAHAWLPVNTLQIYTCLRHKLRTAAHQQYIVLKLQIGNIQNNVHHILHCDSLLTLNRAESFYPPAVKRVVSLVFICKTPRLLFLTLKCSSIYSRALWWTDF